MAARFFGGARYSIVATAVAAFMFGLGLLWHALPATAGLVRPLTPYLLLAFGIASLAPLAARGGVRAVAWMAASFVSGFALEAVGVATGMVFGPYEYSNALGAKLLGVPPIIGFNWVVVVSGCAEAASALVSIALSWWRGARRENARRVVGASSVGASSVTAIGLGAVAAGLMATAFDWAMEPAAVTLGYWTWLSPSIPIRNYLAWFAFAASAAALSPMGPAISSFVGARAGPTADRPKFGFATGYALIQLGFFAGVRALDAAGALHAAGTIG